MNLAWFQAFYSVPDLGFKAGTHYGCTEFPRRTRTADTIWPYINVYSLWLKARKDPRGSLVHAPVQRALKRHSGAPSAPDAGEKWAASNFEDFTVASKCFTVEMRGEASERVAPLIWTNDLAQGGKSALIVWTLQNIAFITFRSYSSTSSSKKGRKRSQKKNQVTFFWFDAPLWQLVSYQKKKNVASRTRFLFSGLESNSFPRQLERLKATSGKGGASDVYRFTKPIYQGFPSLQSLLIKELIVNGKT